MTGKPATIDEYLAALSEDKRAALDQIRKTIRAAAPKAEECTKRFHLALGPGDKSPNEQITFCLRP